MSARAVAVAAGLAADRLLGEPPSDIHPVAGFGSGMSRLEGAIYADNRAAGTLFAAGGVAAGTLAGWTAQRLAVGDGRTPRPGRVLASVAGCTYLAVAGSALVGEAAHVGRLLDGGDLEGARSSLPALVSRDPSRLDVQGAARAAVESVAENTVDAVVAPAFWALLAGAPGVLAYRAVNTLDAMVGYRSARYLRFGWASARLDDLAAWLPARITAALVALVRPRRAREVWRSVRRQAPSHPSPNAGVAEAAFAAALGVTLGGTNFYAGSAEARSGLGAGPQPGVRDIARACRLSRDVAAAMGALMLLPVTIRSISRGRA